MPNGFKVDDQLMMTIMHFATHSNGMAPMHPWPQFVEFANGDPHLPQPAALDFQINFSSLRWDRSLMDKTLNLNKNHHYEAKMNIEKAYNTWAGQYDTNENKTRDLDRKATIETLTMYDFKNVVELGSGTGKNTERLITIVEQILYLDFSHGMLDIAAEKIGPKVKFIKTDLNRDWGVQNEFADLITCNLTLEHIKNLDYIFNQAYL